MLSPMPWYFLTIRHITVYSTLKHLLYVYYVPNIVFMLLGCFITGKEVIIPVLNKANLGGYKREKMQLKARKPDPSHACV